MSLIILALSAVTVLSTTLKEAATICPNAEVRRIQPAEGAELKRLGDLPPAEAYLTVMRTENGCIRPVLVREERARRR